jgi:hypothetical protein
MAWVFLWQKISRACHCLIAGKRGGNSQDLHRCILRFKGRLHGMRNKAYYFNAKSNKANSLALSAFRIINLLRETIISPLRLFS